MSFAFGIDDSLALICLFTVYGSFFPNVLPSSSVGLNGVNHGIIAGADRHSKLFDGSSNFVLTYEDKEGDWMLVGDVPWWYVFGS